MKPWCPQVGEIVQVLVERDCGGMPISDSHATVSYVAYPAVFVRTRYGKTRELRCDHVR